MITRHVATALLLVALLTAYTVHSVNAVCGNNILEVGEQCDNTTAGSCCLTTCLSALNHTVTNPSAPTGSFTLPYALTTTLASLGLTTAGANYPVSWSIASVGAGSATYDPGVIFSISSNTNLNWNRVFVGTFNVTFQTVYCVSPFRALYFYRQLSLNQYENCSCVTDVLHPWCTSAPTRADETNCDCFTRQCYRRDSSTPATCGSTKCRAGYDCTGACNDLLVSKPRSFTILGNDCGSTSNQCTQTANLACTCNAVCGDNIVDTGEQCDAGSPAPYGSCCTHNCSTTPLNPSPSTGTYTLTTCTNSVAMTTLGLLTTGSNYVVVYEVVSVTNVSALSATITGGTTLQFNRTYAGVAVVTFRALFCNATSQYVTFTRTITATGCCGNSIIEYGEICDVGPTSGQAGSCCTTDCRPLNFVGGQTYTPVCKGNQRMYTMGEIGLDTANIQLSAMSIIRNQTWYQGVGETNREFYTDWSQASIFTNASSTYLRFVAGIIGGVNLTFSYNYCNSPASTLTFWKTLWIPECVCSYCQQTAGFGPYCNYATSASNPLLSANPFYKCDCSKVTCFQVNTASLAYGNLTCPTVLTGAGCFTDGYDTCPHACEDVFSPKPVSFSVQYRQTDENNLPCPIGVSPCNNGRDNLAQYWLNCSCAAVCGDGIVDTNEFCDTGAGGGTGVSSCCTTNCLAPTSTSPATFSFTMPSCAALVSLSTIQITTTGGNFIPSWSVANYTGLTGLSPSISSGNLLFGNFFTGTVTFTLRSRWCNNPNQYIYVTRTITSDCCDNSVINIGEDCDLGASGNGGATTCCSNNCQFRPTSRVCRSSASACDAPENCLGNNATCPPDIVYNSSVVCRPAVSTCDVAETCNGISNTCPTDTFANSSTLCRAAADFCDVAEFCSGSSSTCPTNVFKSSSVVCRNATTVCDVQETCTGSSATCPADGFASSSVVCRVANGTCDQPETCTGLSSTCPADVFYTNTRLCRNASGICDVAEYCTGSSNACPTDFFATAGTTCRPATDLCDQPETCTGSSPSCPTDVLRPSNYTCRTSIGPCDLSENCTGSSAVCPADTYAANGVECRPVAGTCDLAEVCTGAGPTCPVDSFRPNGFMCRDVAGPCDAYEYCTGSSATCPADGVQNAGTICRGSDGVCDPQDVCDGVTVTCVDVLYNSSVVCRAAQGPCDAPENCTGVDTSCPVDVFQSSSFVCRPPAGGCDVAETCTGLSILCPTDLILPGGYVCAVSNNSCTVNTTCTGASTTCPSNAKAPGTSCSVDGNLCYMDTCAANGTCLRGAAVNYNDGLYCNGLETCNPLTGGVVAGTPPNCNDGNSCTSDTCSNLLSSCVNNPLPGTTGPCNVGLGACTGGNYSCNGAGPSPVVTCVGAPTPVPEVCFDSIDNNCNGQVDEFCTAQPCTTVADCANITIGACDIITCTSGVCNVTLKAENATCDDGHACTYGDKCDGVGTCAGTAVVCDDGQECTYDYCEEPYGRCVFNGAVLEGVPCVIGHCDGQGQCIYDHIPCPIVDESLCVRYVYNRRTGVCEETPRQGACDDGDACTLFDSCVEGVCLGQPKPCDDYIDCTVDSCIVSTGVCQHVIESDKCRIDGRCWLDGEVNPQCACSVCNASLTTAAWSPANDALFCDDGDACTEGDACDPGTGQCVGTPIVCTTDLPCHTASCENGACRVFPLVNGEPCDDGQFCTVDDVCIEGGCRGVPTNCSILDTECIIGVCQEGFGCSIDLVADYTRCNVSNDVCQGLYYCFMGDCVVGQEPLSCPPSSNPCTQSVCDPERGCIETPLEGLECDDGNNCTQADVCNANGVCVPGGLWINCDDLDPCTDDFCTAEDGCLHLSISNCELCNVTADCSQQTCQQARCVGGACRYVAEPTGFSCADADVCNGQEVCSGNGVCVSLGPLVCDDGNACTDDSCDPLLGCQFVVNTLNACDDGNACTANDTCTHLGECFGETFPCHRDTDCREYECVDVDNVPTCIATPVNIGGSCSTRDPCMNEGVCDDRGNCVEEPLQCPPATECIVDYECVNATCVPITAPNGVPCELGNVCKLNECIGGACVAVADVVTCTPGPQCQVDAICVPATGECLPVFAEDYFDCDDDDVCTQVSYCVGGACIGSEPLLCVSANPCDGPGVCNSTSQQCEYEPLPDYTPCASENVLSNQSYINSVCIAGVCTNTDLLYCPPVENECLIPRLDSEAGCVYDFEMDGIFCDDDDLCTFDEQCHSGECTGGTPVDCSYATVCGVTYCLASSGCIAPVNDCKVCTQDSDCPYVPCKSTSCNAGVCAYAADDTALSGCDDSQFCNGREYCFAGSCMVRPVPDCDDFNDCTVDTCDYTLQQCRHTPAGNITCQNDDLCAISSQCDGQGHCLTVMSIDCGESAPCRESLGCNSKTGACEYSFAQDGDECVLEDNNCAERAECYHGVCHLVQELECTKQCGCDASTTCDVATGSCIATTSCNHDLCSDGDPCTLGDKCDGTSCVPGQYSPCDFINQDPQCQVAKCLPGGGCVYENVEDGSSCTTTIPRGPCSGEDVCDNGACVRRYREGTVCREAAPGGCDVAEYCNGWGDDCPDNDYAEEDTPCPDSLFCYSSTCRRGRCLPSTPRDCSDLDGPCTIGVCDEESNVCAARPKVEHTPCVSGLEGQCVRFSSCRDGVCTPQYANELTPCDDGSPCSVDDHCSGYNANCIAGTSTICSHLDTPCSMGACNPLTGACMQISINEGVPCNADSNPCTANDTCVAGQCVSGSALDCSYLNSSCQYGLCSVLSATSAVCTPIYTERECDPDYCSGGCTVPFQWWSLHTSHCKNPAQQFTWPDGLENVPLCGQTLYEWSQRRARTLWIALMHEWLAASLNQANGACLPPTVINDYLTITALVQQCNTEITSTDSEAGLYKSYAIILRTYNSGMLGPGECTQAPCAASLFDSDYFACLFQTRDVVARTDQVDFFSADTCENGVWDYVSEMCQCFVGWAGIDCTECDSGVNPDEVYVCVPSMVSRDYILRSVPIEELSLYVDDQDLLEIVRMTGRRSRYPGDGKVDCACRRVGDDVMVSARDLTVYIAQDDTVVYIDTIEQNLQLCEQVFDVTVINANPDCQNDTITVEVPGNESSCGVPSDWQYICDCCGPDDPDCVCPKNDVMCLRNHVLDEHRRLRLYQRLFIIFASVAGLLFIYTVMRIIQERRKKKKAKKQQPLTRDVLVNQRLTWRRKGRK